MIYPKNTAKNAFVCGLITQINKIKTTSDVFNRRREI